MKETIRKLVEAWGPSGFEHHVRALIREEVAALADEIRVDAMGNLICRFGQKSEGGLRVMLAAHMDEIGVMISHIDRQGFLRFVNIGGLLLNTLHAGRIRFENGVTGVIGIEEAWRANRTKLPGLESFFIDVHTGDGERADVQVGAAGAFWRPMEERGNMLISKSMDDRIGCAVLIETLRKLKSGNSPHEIYFVFTVQEEVGLRGAQPAAYGIAPDFALAIDITATGDMPKGVRNNLELGKGAAIKIMDTGQIVPPVIWGHLIATAERHNIPYQREILDLGTTDAKAIEGVLGGVPSGALSIPGRHVHTTSETVDIRDVQAVVDLLVAVLSNPIENIRPV